MWKNEYVQKMHGLIQTAALYERSVSTTAKHIGNIFAEDEQVE